jgi:hypothetical protein
MSVARLALTAALQAVGNAQVYIGDPFTASGLSCIGAKEGPIEVEIEETFNDLTAEELTGPTVHQRTLMGQSIKITIPLILGDTALYAKISPTGAKGGGYDSPQVVTTTSVVIIPDAEVGGGLTNATGATSGWVRATGYGITGVSGSGAAPVHAIWLWRATPATPSRSFSYENGGKIIVPVTFQAMYSSTNTVDGQRVWTLGDPAAQSITTIRL